MAARHNPTLTPDRICLNPVHEPLDGLNVPTPDEEEANKTDLCMSLSLGRDESHNLEETNVPTDEHKEADEEKSRENSEHPTKVTTFIVEVVGAKTVTYFDDFLHSTPGPLCTTIGGEVPNCPTKPHDSEHNGAIPRAGLPVLDLKNDVAVTPKDTPVKKCANPAYVCNAKPAGGCLPEELVYPLETGLTDTHEAAKVRAEGGPEGVTCLDYGCTTRGEIGKLGHGPHDCVPGVIHSNGPEEVAKKNPKV